MALLSRDPPPFLYSSKILPTKNTFQPLSRSFYDNPADICCTKSYSATRWRFPLKIGLKQQRGPLQLDCCNILRRGKRPWKGTISSFGFAYSVSLFGIVLQRDNPYRFKSGRLSRYLRALDHHPRNTSTRAWKGDFKNEPGRAEHFSGRKVFTPKGLAAESLAGDSDVQKEKVLDSEAGGSRRRGSEESERNVVVEVEAVSWRERQIRANICVEASYQAVWEVLTAYERLVEFIPNLVRSERVTSPHPKRIWLLQQGVQSAMYWHIEARVVLDLEELPHAEEGKELRFQMVDGDFKHYAGRWYLRPGPRSDTTNLHFEVNVTPKLFFPAVFLDRIISKNLPINMRAIAHRAETNSLEWKNILRPSKLSSKQATPSPLLAFRNKPPTISQVFPAGLITSSLQGSPSTETDYLGKENLSGLGLDTSLVGDKSDSFRAETCQLDEPCTVDEVHLRRLDDLLENGGGHRRVVAAMTVESPIRDIWNVLTDYECLSKFIPNLASCKIISRKNHHVRLVQEGCKNIFFMVLHARAVLDLWEKPDHEIIFQQVEGDFDSLRGKWNLEPLGPQHTLLKYVVDIKMHKHCLLAEAVIEEITYVDLAKNLCAIRAEVELRREKAVHVQAPTVQDTVRNSLKQSPSAQLSSARMLPEVQGKRFRVAGLQTDFRILEKELFSFILEHGREGYMPMRKELREHKRVDLEKAIFRMGGFSVVATRLNLSQQRRPRGYWDHFQNLRKEILLFQIESGMDKTYMPTRNSLNKAGRHDVARALEKWGGVREVARLLGLNVRRVSLQSPVKIMALGTSSITDNDFISQKPFKTSLPSKPKKWVDLKQ